MPTAHQNRLRLLINIDHVATVRNARGGLTPDPVAMSRTCLAAGADGIVCHLREDRRHIRDSDVQRLRTELSTKLDLEMAAAPGIIRFALKVKPDLVTLVPERRRELTTEGGLDIIRSRRRMAAVVKMFHDHDIPVSLFVAPKRDQIEASAEIGADMVELHTGEYAEAQTRSKIEREFRRIEAAAVFGRALGMGVNAGHGLDYTNTARIARIGAIQEMSIGYAIIVRALSVGLKTAVREMVGITRAARRDYEPRIRARMR